AVDDHRARAARPAVADAFHTRHLEPRAQRIEQRDARLELEPMHLAVDIEGDRNSARTDLVDGLRSDARGSRQHASGYTASADCLQEVASSETRLRLCCRLVLASRDNRPPSIGILLQSASDFA